MSSTCNEDEMCELGLYSRKDAKKWLMENHPDKGGKVDNAVFGNVAACNKARIYCSDEEDEHSETKSPVDITKLRKRMFTCMRQTENFSKLRPEFRVDSKKFDVEKFESEYIDYSPKLAQLFSIIKDLDENDMKTHGKKFKHFIFSDVKEQGYGVKVLVAGFDVNGYDSVIKVKPGDKNTRKKNKKLAKPKPKLVLKSSDGPDSYAYLASNSMFGADFKSKLKKEVLTRFNARPTNAHGDDIRFIILDSGYKEGIDLFDVKYVHIFEPSMTIADLKQTIGRATRTCGQRGLNFQPNVGWPLYVYNYFIVVPDHTKEALVAREPELLNAPVEDNKVFKEGTKFKDGVMYYSQFDKALVNLSAQLFDLGPILSVDYELTKNMHGTEEPTYMYESDSMAIQMGGVGAKFNKVATVKCDGKCGKKSTLDIPVSVEFMKKVYTSNGHSKAAIPKKESRAFFCKYMTDHPEFCAQVNRAWATRAAAVPKVVAKSKTPKQAKDAIVQVLDLVPIHEEDEPDYEIATVKGHVEENMKRDDGPAPPKRRLGFAQMRNFIRTNFGAKFKWSPVEIVNKCGEPPKGGDLSKLITFNPTQNFVSHYFTPASPYKGMLLWHSVGTGKTCTAIATATSSFEREGYTILWVTRTTLKTDIWKNMFGQICHTIIADRVRKGLELPDNDAARKRLLSRNWIQPMSYKQFSNLLTGKNQIYEDLKKRNGAEDVVRKTLIIIDEAHKLYGGDLKSSERPDMNVMEKFLANSYAKSGKDSARLLIMTATPFTNSPMELFKLINMCIEEKGEKIPDDIAKFKEIYMNDNDLLSNSGSKKLANQLSGYVSYLNREKDPTQFAQPIMIEVPVVMSAAPEDVRPFLYKEKSTADVRAEKKEVMADYKERIAALRSTIKESRAINKSRNKTLKEAKKKAKEDCKEKHPGRKEKAERDKCIEDAVAKAVDDEEVIDIDALKKELDDAISEKKSVSENIKTLLQNVRVAKKERTKLQDVMLRERCKF